MNSPSLRRATLWRPLRGGEAVLFGLKVGQPVGPGAMPTALPMTRTISAMAITASANSRRVSSDELRRWAVELIGFLCIGAWCRRRSPASSCARVARSARGFQQPCGPRRGRCRSSGQAHGWCSKAVRIGSATAHNPPLSAWRAQTGVASGRQGRSREAGAR